jgi:pyruvate,orthophosphate dikinase
MQTPEQFVSQAYLANLAETYIEKVEFDKKYEPLIHAFHSFPALKNQFENLLKEVFHPYRNTQLVLEELRLFLLNNVGYIYKNEFFDQFLQLLFDLLFGFYGEEKNVNTKVSEIILSLLKKTIENGRDITKLKFLFNTLIERFLGLNENQFKSFFEIAISLKRILGLINEKIVDEDLEFLSRQLLIRYFSNVYSLYRQIKDKLPSNQEIIENFNLIEKTDLTLLTLKELLSLPDHLELLRILKEVIFKIISYKETSLGEEERVSVLLSLLEISDLGLLHEELLRDVNKILVSMIEAKPHEHIEEFIVKFFVFLKQKSNLYPWTVFECIKSIGTAILRKRAVYLTEVFIQEVLKYGFTPPAITGIDLNWRVKRNPYHVQNIKVWLEIYRQNPEWCSSLLIGLIIYIKLYGVSINDTDLFQREIIFHEIGAEGLIRDLSTHLDEIYGRKNTLFHFLRKFIHVESSSLVVNLMEDIMRFWFTLNPSHIAKYLPDVLLNKIISEEFKYHLEMQNIFFSIFKLIGIYEIEKLFELNVDQLERYISSINADNDLKTVIINFLKLYNLIRQKYYFSLSDLEELVREYSGLGFNFVEELPTILKEKKLYEQIEIILTWLLYLKEHYILSSEKFQKKEEIIKKRHIAADIPSIFGRYSEPKFDALGLSFRLEWILNTLFAKLTEEFRFQIFSESTMKRILNIMKLFKTALEVDGISSQRFNRYLHILENSLLSYPLTFNQYVDIFKGLLEGVQHIIKSYYINPYQ